MFTFSKDFMKLNNAWMLGLTDIRTIYRLLTVHRMAQVGKGTNITTTKKQDKIDPCSIQLILLRYVQRLYTPQMYVGPPGLLFGGLLHNIGLVHFPELVWKRVLVFSSAQTTWCPHYTTTLCKAPTHFSGRGDSDWQITRWLMPAQHVSHTTNGSQWGGQGERNTNLI